MSNSIRLQQKRENMNNDEDFIVVDAPYYGVDYLSCAYLIPKSSIKKERLALACYLISNYSKSCSLLKEKLEFKASNSNISYHLSFEELYQDYLILVRVESPSYLVDKSTYSNQMKATSLIKRLMKRGWSEDEGDLNRAKEYVEQLYYNLNSQEEFKLDKLVKINLIPNVYGSNYPFGDLQVIKKLNKADIDAAIKGIGENSSRIVTYIGNTDYRPVILFRDSIKPSAKVFPLAIKETILTSPKDLILNDDILKGELGVVYKVPEANSEQYLLLSLILQNVLKKVTFIKGISLISIKPYYRAGVIYLTFQAEDKVFLPSDKDEIIHLMNSLNKVIEADVFNQSKKELESGIIKEANPINISNKEIFSRLLGLNLENPTLLPLLEKIDFEVFDKYLNQINLIGSLILTGKGEKDV